MVDSEALAWAAGFFDGEGCTTNCTSNGRIYPRVSVTQADTRPLRRFQAAVGGLGSIYEHDHGNPNWAEQYQWSTTNTEEAQAVVAMLWKYLSGPKREQASAVFSEWKDQPPDARKWSDGTCKRGHDITDSRAVYVGSDGRRRCLRCRWLRDGQEHRRIGDGYVALQGEHNPHAEITEQDVIEIRQRYEEEDTTYTALSDEYAVGPSAIGAIVRGDRWSHVAPDREAEGW